MSRKNRKTKSPRRRTRRKKRSKLMAALVIEVISAVALFGAYRFAQDVRSSQQPEQPASQQLQPSAAWPQFASAEPTQAETPQQKPVFRTSRLFNFSLPGEGS